MQLLVEKRCAFCRAAAPCVAFPGLFVECLRSEAHGVARVVTRIGGYTWTSTATPHGTIA